MMKKVCILSAVVVTFTLLAGSGTVAVAADDTAEALLAWAKEDKGYQEVFKKDLSNAIMSGKKKRAGWAFEGDVLTSKGRGDIWSEERYGDFALQLDFKTAPDTNSGVFIRTSSIRDWLNTAIEVQILQPNDGADKASHTCGGIFDIVAPKKQMVKAAGEWNHYVIVCKDNRIVVELNGEITVDMDLNRWKEAGKNPDGSPNKFKYAYAELEREGHIGLQYHGHPIWFRDVKIKPMK